MLLHQKLTTSDFYSDCFFRTFVRLKIIKKQCLEILWGMMGKLKETQQKIEDTKKRLNHVFVDETTTDGSIKVSISANREIKIN
ncbi:hypothetical protein CCAN11_2340012 [Capnocytophaga canimorsus]|uniref:Uncharacterized protein n=1 Tax=Capnocytophaga canimorsus TaxID=28188 RepID=A0A0B7IM84_9FLAO|nr:hypothetical protein CCAN11_2340012 [Capnocytophaga canimorsus]